MKPYVHQEELFMWNLHGSVGFQAQNSRASDISYLQWYYTLAAAFHETPEERKAVYRQVQITGKCNGTEHDPLVRAIWIHQQALNHPYVDGRASVVPGYSGSLRIGGKAYFVIRLGARFSWLYPHTWPRLDLIPGCPPSVAVDVRKAVPIFT